MTRFGQPCQQSMAADANGCLWHRRSPEQRKILAMKGGVKTAMRRALPAEYAVSFGSREAVIGFAQDVARRVLTDDVDPKRIDTALRAAGVALSAYAMGTQEKLVDALLRMEHGGTAMMLLSRLQEGMEAERRMLLPGRRGGVPMPVPVELQKAVEMASEVTAR